MLRHGRNSARLELCFDRFLATKHLYYTIVSDVSEITEIIDQIYGVLAQALGFLGAVNDITLILIRLSCLQSDS
jgi:hypothetical protein